MANTYDSTADVREHIRKFRYWMDDIIHLLEGRARTHDISKLSEPEKSTFDQWTPRLKEVAFGGDEYKAALVSMGEGLKHHYQANRHHPEHYENGVNGMTLVDLVEMVCDWMAAAEAKGQPIDIDYLAQRFNLSPQLVDIILNWLREEDFWCSTNGVPVTYFTPEKYRKPYDLHG